ncbi:MAG: hypothetical protein ACRDRU_03105 [Pseudonocardiaceae bacterium]
MGRSRYHDYHRYYRHRGLVRRPVGPLLVLLCAALLATVGLTAVALVTMLVVLGVPVLFGVGAVVVTRHLYRRHRRATGWRQPPPVARIQPVADWSATRARFAQLTSEYGQFECDPLAVLRLPALTDVTVASTSRFVDTFAEAQALDTDTKPPAAHQARFATAVDQAWRAWRAARDAAERIRLAGIPEPERATVQRAIKLLTVAQNSSHDAERIAAYAKARTELAKLENNGTLRLPPPATAALNAAARIQLPAGYPSRHGDISG